jgi:hypothetical protein
MPRKRILAHRQPAQEDDHYSDPLFREDGESPETPTLFHGRTQQSTAKTSRTKNKNFLARLILNKRSRKRKDDLEQLVAGTEYNKTDYRERWPTVTTLVAPSIPNFLEDIDEELEEDGKARRRSTKAKALGAVAMPLDWLADRLGSVSEHLGRQIEVADSRAQEKAVATSTRGSTAKPGKSTHPYDTGVVPSVEATPKENPTAPAETQVTDTGKIKGDGLSRGKGDPRSPTKQRHRRPSDRSATSERSHHKVLLEHRRAIVTPTNQRSTAQGRQYLQLSSEAIEEPMLLEERNKW